MLAYYAYSAGTDALQMLLLFQPLHVLYTVCQIFGIIVRTVYQFQAMVERM